MRKEKKDIVHKDLLIRVLEYCYPKEIFTLGDIKDGLKLKEQDMMYLTILSRSSKDAKQIFERLDLLPEDKIKAGIGVGINHYLRLTPNAVFNYLEYIELVEAKKNAIESKKLAIWAIIISVTAILTPIIIQVIT